MITGLLFGIAYFIAYAFLVFDKIDDFEEDCARPGSPVNLIKVCLAEIARKSMAALALLAYIPSLCVCLYHIDRLDAVMDTIETIHELEDIGRAVRAFDRSMEEVAEQVVLLKAIDERVLTRINMIVKFGGRVGGMIDSGGADGAKQFLDALQQLVDCLEQIGADLMPVAAWLELSSDDQDAVSDKVHTAIRDLTTGNFGLARRSQAPRESFVPPGLARSSTVSSSQEGGSMGPGIEMLDASAVKVAFLRQESPQVMSQGTFCEPTSPNGQTVPQFSTNSRVSDASEGSWKEMSAGTFITESP